MFGHAFKKKYFPLSNNEFVPVNHGSYGLPPQQVIDKYFQSTYNDLRSPDTYLRLHQPAQYLRSLEAIAEFVNSDAKNLAFVENATSGVNTVLRLLRFKEGDVIVLLSTTYGACANTVRFLSEFGIKHKFVQLDLPLENDEIVSLLEDTLASTSGVKLALFDAVASMPGVRLPYERMVQSCKKFGVLSLVDGAHGVGLIDLDLNALEADFFCTNLHKWLYLPRGCALLYVDPKHHREVQTLPISHSYVAPDAALTLEQEDKLMISKFTFIGLKNDAAVSCVEEALKFRKQICGGEKHIQEWCYALAKKAGKIAEKRLGATVIENSEETFTNAMVTMFLPIEKYLPSFDTLDPAAVAKFTDAVIKCQTSKYRTMIPVGIHAGKVIIRLSAQVYNEESDYEYACDTFDKALREVFERSSTKL